jgi:O-methyltransferase
MAGNTDGKRLLPINVTLPDGTAIRCDITFPLPDGTVMVQGPLTYNSDGLMTTHSVAWMDDPAFVEAYRRGMATGHRYGDDLHIEWRVFTACWAAQLACNLDGDFVECGVHTGIFSAAACSYIDFNRYPEKHFYLLDTFAGFPDEQKGGLAVGNDYFDTYDLVRATFAEYPNVVVIRGAVPGTLPLVPSERIAYLCIDMNAAEPERAALDYFWDKVVPGGVILLDDYGFIEHEAQRRSFDEFARAHDVRILALPTGHGLLIKPYRAK